MRTTGNAAGPVIRQPEACWAGNGKGFGLRMAQLENDPGNRAGNTDRRGAGLRPSVVADGEERRCPPDCRPWPWWAFCIFGLSAAIAVVVAVTLVNVLLAWITGRSA